MAYLFGVNQASIEAELSGIEGVPDFSADITTWIERYSHSIERRLRAQGFEVADVYALGASDSLYSLCAEYITHCVCARLMSSGAMQDTEKAETHREEAQRLLDELRDTPEATTPTSDPDTNMGSARTNKRYRGDGVIDYRPHTIFNRRMKF